MLCHARGASPGSGLPIVNNNNHPFVSHDLSIGLIHNGKVSNSTYNKLIKNYQVESSCDSEILLRIFQSNKNKDKLNKIKSILENAYESHMAIAIGEIIEKERRLYLFRNEFRSLYFVDMIEELNQCFFVSTKEIWDKATDCFNIKYKIEEIPIEDIWILEIKNNKLILEKFETKTQGFQIQNNKDFYKIEKVKLSDKNIYTNLNEKEESLEPDIQIAVRSKEICSNIISDLFELEDKIQNNIDEEFLNKLISIEKDILNLLKK
jgi:glucosamine 6-phosphate synthetase-like amidotransferase/phosphosugar isomerase protein